MANYTIVTNFLSKDSLVSGNALKALKGAELTTEFTAVQTAVNTKFDGSSVFAPDGTAGQPSFGFTNSSGTGMYNAAGVLNFATASTQRMSINAAGAITMNAATGATTLSLTGASGQVAAQFTGVGASSFGLVVSGANVAGATGADIRGGTSASDWALILRNGAASVLWNFAGDGGLYAQGVSGSSLGSGSINAGVLAVSGNPVYAGIPQNSQGGSYTAVLADANKHIFVFAAGATITIPANASVAYPVGAALTIINGNAGTTSIAINTDTLRLANSASTGTRALATNGIATAIKVASTTWYISGTGLT